MSRKIRKKFNCDSKTEEVTVLADQLSKLVKTLTELVTYIVENNKNNEIQDNQIDEENSMTVPAEGINNNDSRVNSNIQVIGDSIYSKYNANSPRENKWRY
ncbi:hypothetical protein [uncultured Clostridium sp.]|uniref:hypothetical protein n=1 Tax=uncultured Clostridium sp. TaxID=59620 RepID=UPI0025EEAEAF|nr:hypothetical protein [uncultured Clostridium sp.]